MPQRNDTAIWSGLFRISAESGQTLQAQIRQAIVAAILYGQFDPALFPTAEWRECNRMALAVLEIRNWASDMVDRDDPLLIEQIQARLLPRRGIFANPDEIIVTLGAQNALYMLATLLMSKGSKVAMEDPGYPDARSIFRLAGAEIQP
ncbi:MAG: aminotransferase class I/II-fold pyridoxal phosphate-dependent enzyme, partial [Mesorhizobium sp.]